MGSNERQKFDLLGFFFVLVWILFWFVLCVWFLFVCLFSFNLVSLVCD